MSLSPSKASGKPKTPIRYRPTQQEGKNIRYKLSLAGIKLSAVARTLSADRSTVSKVTRGLRRSARIESEIARILGKESWNDVVLEARSEVQKKPVEVIKQEIEQRILAVRKAAEERMAEHMAHNADRVKHIVGGVKADKRRRGA